MKRLFLLLTFAFCLLSCNSGQSSYKRIHSKQYFLDSVKFAKNFTITNDYLKLTPQISSPLPPLEGMIYTGTDHHIYYYNGTEWKQLDNDTSSPPTSGYYVKNPGGNDGNTGLSDAQAWLTVAGVTRDFDLYLWLDPPSIGCYEYY
jgi:hypothetical protein